MKPEYPYQDIFLQTIPQQVDQKLLYLSDLESDLLFFIFHQNQIKKDLGNCKAYSALSCIILILKTATLGSYQFAGLDVR